MHLRLFLSLIIAKSFNDWNQSYQSYNSNDYLRLFKHMKDNQLFYKTCFKLGIGERPIIQYDVDAAKKYYGEKNITYHAEFFRGGFNRIVKIWLENGCQESPEDMVEIIHSEYQGR